MPALLGQATMRATVALPSVAWYFQPTSLTATASIAAPTSALRRRSIGVGPDVRGLAVHVDVHAARGVAAHHDADGHRLAVEDRPLLDVQLEVGVDAPPADRGLAVVADALELGAEDLAVVVAQGEHPVDVEDARRRRPRRPWAA